MSGFSSGRAPRAHGDSRLHASAAESAAMQDRFLRRMGHTTPCSEEEAAQVDPATLADYEARRQREARRQVRPFRHQAAHPANRIIGGPAGTLGSRVSRPAPRPSRQYAQATSTEPIRDQRLSSGASRCLVLLRARLGRTASGVISKASLAKELGCHPRSVQRYFAALRTLGYITTSAVTNGRGRQTGQRITLAAKVLPYWDRTAGPGHQRLPSAGRRGLPPGETDPAPEKISYESERRARTERERLGKGSTRNRARGSPG